MFTRLQRSRFLKGRIVSVILVLVLIGTYAMITFTKDSQSREVVKTTKITKIIPTPLATTKITKIIPTRLATPKDLCANTSGPSVYTVCTWDFEHDDVISERIHRTGQWEPSVTETLYRVLKQDRKITFIDIGANIGYFSLLAASLGQSAIAVEPWKLNIEKIQQSILKNKFEGKIYILNNAVSNNHQMIRIQAPYQGNPGASRLFSDPTVTGSNLTLVSTITLNDLANYIHTKDVVIKMDIEGHECRALEKSDVIFDKFNVLFVSLEWEVMQMFENDVDTACPTEKIGEIVDMLAKRDFVPYNFENVRQHSENYTKWNNYDKFWIPKKDEALYTVQPVLSSQSREKAKMAA